MNLRGPLVACLVVVGLAAYAQTLGAATMSLEGVVSDSQCGAKHKMTDAAACTKACVSEGADYALVVGNKVYTLKTTMASEKTELAKLAGKEAKVTGDVNGTTVMVKTVAMMMPAKK